MASSPIEIRLAQYGMGMSDAEITEVMVTAGQRVAAGDIIFVADAAKATVDICAPTGGTISSLAVTVGDEPLVGDLLAILQPDDAL